MQELRDDPIVVTGRGAVSGCGYGTGPLLAAVRTGQPGGRWVEVAGQRYAACLVETFPGTGKGKRLDPSVQFALAAADEAMREAGLMPPREGSPSSGLPDPDQTGVVVGTSRGCQAQWETALKDLSGNKRPYILPKTTLGNFLISSNVP